MRVTVPGQALAGERPPGLRTTSHEGGLGTGTTGRRRRQRRARARRAGVLTAAAGLALLAAACSSGTSSSGGTSSAGGTSSTGTGGASSAYVSDKVSLARCLRAHGLPDYPDPNAEGQEPPGTKQMLRGNPQAHGAFTACSRWANRISNDVAAQNQAIRVEYLRFAACMRSHGLPEFPDPTYAEGRVEFVLSASKDGFDPHSPQVLAKARACEGVLPPGSGLPSVQVTS